MDRAERAKVDLGSDPWSLGFNFSSLFLGLVALFLVYQAYEDLPDQIATHFNARGEADGWGSKASLYALPLVQMGLCVMMLYLANKPQYFNLPMKITTNNARAHFRLGRRLISWVNLGLQGCFLWLTYLSIEIGSGRLESLPKAFIPTFIGLTLLPLVVYLILANRIPD